MPDVRPCSRFVPHGCRRVRCGHRGADRAQSARRRGPLQGRVAAGRASAAAVHLDGVAVPELQGFDPGCLSRAAGELGSSRGQQLGDRCTKRSAALASADGGFLQSGLDCSMLCDARLGDGARRCRRAAVSSAIRARRACARSFGGGMASIRTRAQRAGRQRLLQGVSAAADASCVLELTESSSRASMRGELVGQARPGDLALALLELSPATASSSWS